MSEGRFASPAEIDGFYRQLVERFRLVPGVVQASVSAPAVPLLGAFYRQFSIPGQTTDGSSSLPRTTVQMVTPEYFETFGIRILQGRALTADDKAGGEHVAVVNERFVKRFLAGRDPLNQRVAMNQFASGNPRQGYGPGAPGAPVEWRIVGVFHDVTNLEQFGDPAAPQI